MIRRKGRPSMSVLLTVCEKASVYSTALEKASLLQPELESLTTHGNARGPLQAFQSCLNARVTQAPDARPLGGKELVSAPS
ncbi:hypothetical protein BU16DRAFT_220816 [Lophium mytilinum]|uniref:Uncharacterized protein n=1 Tax=Lophium mytilinum TaxID=390894 RepID=A0A6A6QAB7_9PEZI|nr:hypothetical protein BU16DRAFT_220816 [Lophium mytilinum]